jgi:signal transduction histidine kinase
MDWQFAFERSEMLRQIQSELLLSIGHELRSPLTKQLGSLDLLLLDLCNSPSEEKDYLLHAKQAVIELIRVLEEYTDLTSQWLPIQPLHLQELDLVLLLQEVYKLTSLPAKDRGITFLWKYSQDPMWVMADPDGLKQALLGLCYWSIQHLRHGTLTLSLHREKRCLLIQTLGQTLLPLTITNTLIWEVPQRLLERMHSSVTLVDSSSTHFMIEVMINPQLNFSTVKSQ